MKHGQQQDLAKIKVILVQVLAHLPPFQSSQSTPTLTIEDNTTKRDKEKEHTWAVDKGKWKVGEEV